MVIPFFFLDEHSFQNMTLSFHSVSVVPFENNIVLNMSLLDGQKYSLTLWERALLQSMHQSLYSVSVVPFENNIVLNTSLLDGQKDSLFWESSLLKSMMIHKILNLITNYLLGHRIFVVILFQAIYFRCIIGRPPLCSQYRNRSTEADVLAGTIFNIPPNLRRVYSLYTSNAKHSGSPTKVSLMVDVNSIDCYLGWLKYKNRRRMLTHLPHHISGRFAC